MLVCANPKLIKSVTKRARYGAFRPGFVAGAERAAEKGLFPKEKCEKHASGPEGHIHFMPLIPGINPRPTARRSFSAAFEAHDHLAMVTARLKPCPYDKAGFQWAS